MSKRRTHSPEFKARVAMEAAGGRKTIQEIATYRASSDPESWLAPCRHIDRYRALVIIRLRSSAMSAHTLLLVARTTVEAP
jgi:hypothetical protein